MKSAGYLAAAVLALALAAVVLAPATLVDSRLAGATAGLLRLGEAEGTLWRGRGTLTDEQGSFAVPLRWTLDPQALLRREVSVRLGDDPASAGGPSGVVAERDGLWRIERLAASFPAGILPALVHSPVPVALGGEIRVDVPHLTLARDAFAGAASLRWTRASIALPALPPLRLGDLDVALGPRGAGLAGAVTARDGDVAVSGDIALTPADLSVDLLLTPAPQAPAAVVRVLGALGRAEGGATRVRWRGAAPWP